MCPRETLRPARLQRDSVRIEEREVDRTARFPRREHRFDAVVWRRGPDLDPQGDVDKGRSEPKQLIVRGLFRSNGGHPLGVYGHAVIVRGTRTLTDS
jgi:hypothetical protein